MATARPSPVGITRSARRRFSASGICLARILARRAGVIPGRARTRWRWMKPGALTTTTRSHSRWEEPSSSSGTSRTTIGRRCRRQIFRKRWVRAPTSGWTMDSRRRRAAASPNTWAPRAGRSTAPSRTASGNASAIAATASPPRRMVACTAASESCSGTPSRRNMDAVVLLPMPIEPVRPMTIIAPAHRGSAENRAAAAAAAPAP